MNAMEKLREDRTSKLCRCDRWALVDRTMTDEQKAYRQELRDLPATASPELDADGKLIGITWPVKPDE